MPEKKIKIAYLTTTNARDRRSWSGIHFYIAQALEKHCGQVHYLGPAQPKFQLGIGKALSAISRKIFGKRYDYSHTFPMAKALARIFRKKLTEGNFDLIFAPTASSAIAFLDTKLPIVILSDTTFINMIGYYTGYTGLWSLCEKQGIEIEKRAVTKSDLLLYPSNWAAKSAVALGADPASVHVIPLGANIDQAPPRDKILERKTDGACKLLFLGVDWERKGGSIAFEAFKKLQNDKINVTLTICGCVPPEEYHEPSVTIIPFINKNDPSQLKQFDQLLMDSHFLILPTRAECFGVVFCEASAYGLISISTDTGGVSGAIKNSVNGFLLSPEKNGEEYAQIIRGIWSEPGKYKELSKSARDYYEEKLNWDAWGVKVKSLIDGLLRR